MGCSKIVTLFVVNFNTTITVTNLTFSQLPTHHNYVTFHGPPPPVSYQTKHEAYIITSLSLMELCFRAGYSNIAILFCSPKMLMIKKQYALQCCNINNPGNRLCSLVQQKRPSYGPCRLIFKNINSAIIQSKQINFTMVLLLILWSYKNKTRLFSHYCKSKVYSKTANLKNLSSQSIHRSYSSQIICNSTPCYRIKIIGYVYHLWL